MALIFIDSFSLASISEVSELYQRTNHQYLAHISFLFTCLLKAAPLTQKQAEFNEISHLSRVSLPPPQTYRHLPHLRTPRPHHLSSSRQVRARNCPCGPVRSAPSSLPPLPGTRAPPVLIRRYRPMFRGQKRENLLSSFEKEKITLNF